MFLLQVNTDSSCGTCGNECAVGASCLADAAAVGGYSCQCPAGQEVCDASGVATCVSLALNGNCGVCGVTCDDAAAPVCNDSDEDGEFECEASDTCVDPNGDCNGSCVDLTKNGNCGTCGTTCEADEVCNDSTDPGTFTCEAADSCAEGTAACDGNCIDVTKNGNCSDCGITCGTGKVCNDSGTAAGTFTCEAADTCPEGTAACGGNCIDVTQDGNCGDCGVTCEANQVCGVSGCEDA